MSNVKVFKKKDTSMHDIDLAKMTLTLVLNKMAYRKEYTAVLYFDDRYLEMQPVALNDIVLEKTTAWIGALAAAI